MTVVSRRIEECRRLGSAELDLSQLSLTAIPDSIVDLYHLRKLDLSFNQISQIREPIDRLSNIETLNLSANPLNEIPGSLARLTSLETLTLSHCEIGTIPEWLGDLTNLRFLDLASNRIVKIPESIGFLANLIYLDLSRNRIKVVPESAGSLIRLESLFLGENRISFIPQSLGHLANLGILDLATNQISAIPQSLARIEPLAILLLQSNPHLGIPDEVLGSRGERNSARSILNYYFAQQEGAAPLNEAKLILVGRGGVGKTSLVKAVMTGKFNAREKTTEGIKISDWACALGRKRAVTLHIWDFGGQEIMHATHQFFLTKRSLYLLVLNRRQGGYDEEADYWLRFIRTFGGDDAPVIVVLNKQKREPFDVNRGGWLEKYSGNIKGFVEADCADTKTITRLKRKIEDQLRAMDSLQAQFPQRWFAIKAELSKMTSDYVTFEQYRQICAKHGETDAERQNSLSGYLNDLGIALNYKDDPRLRVGYVLKPEWVTKGIYALLHAFVTSKGLFSIGEAEVVLLSKGYPVETVDFLVGLMEKFELCFPLGDSKKRMLIPELLGEQQPDRASEFRLEECLNFGYKYSIIPDWLLPRFVVRTHHLSEPSGRWKSGAILQNPQGCRALVRADRAERRVRVHVDGPKDLRRDLLTVIRHNFEVIHSDYGFTPEECVYPHGVPDKPISLEALEALSRCGEATVQVVLADNRVIKPEIAGLMQQVRFDAPMLRLFLSYSHEDEKYVDELRKDLKLMERNGLIRTWYDRKLEVGEKWEPAIFQELKESDIIVCQLSRDFLASDFCVLRELDMAIARKVAGEAELVAYVLKECGWREVAKLKQFQVLPKDGKPLSGWRPKDKYWRAVAEGIQQAVEKVQSKRRPETQAKGMEAGKTR